jgi:hypothetical protein
MELLSMGGPRRPARGKGKDPPIQENTAAMTSNIFSALIVGSLVGIASLPAQAGIDFSRCGLPKRVIMTKNLADIPSPVLAQLPGLGAVHDSILSDADDPSDPINDNIPSVRLAGAFAEGTRWTVVYETGDFANTRMVAIFSATKQRASLIGQQASRHDSEVCAILKAAFPN